MRFPFEYFVNLLWYLSLSLPIYFTGLKFLWSFAIKAAGSSRPEVSGYHAMQNSHMRNSFKVSIVVEPIELDLAAALGHKCSA